MDKIIKYLNQTEEKTNEIIALKHELKEESPENQRYIFYDYRSNQGFLYNKDSFSPITKKYIELLSKKDLQKFIHDDDKISVCQFSYTPMFNKVIFFKNECKNGLTFDKKTKKIRFWYGGNMTESSGLIHAMLRELKHEWFFSMHYFFQNGLTKTLLENILSQKITNPEDYIKKWMKISLKYSFHYKLIKKYFETEEFYFRKNEDIKLPKGVTLENENEYIEKHPEVKDSIKKEALPTWAKASNERFTFFTLYYGFKKEAFLRYIKDYTIEPNFSMQKILSGELSKEYIDTLNDIFDQCKLLGEKINLHWSYNRLQEEHLKFSRKIASIRFVDADLEPIIYFGMPTNPKCINYEIISDEKMAFEEGVEMHNCVYTNYWNKIKNKTYFIFKITYPERCTLGVRKKYTSYNETKSNLRFEIDQVYISRNRNVKPETKQMLSEWVNTREMQNFFVMNYDILDIKDVQTLEQIEKLEEEAKKIIKKAV